MMRFLRYSLDKQKKIRVVFLIDGVLSHANVTVTALTDTSVAFTSAKHKQPQALPLECVLSASYARGDSGEWA